MKKVNNSSNRPRQSDSDSREDTRSEPPHYTRRASASANTEDRRISRYQRRAVRTQMSQTQRLEAKFRDACDESEAGDEELEDQPDLSIPAFISREQTG